VKLAYADPPYPGQSKKHYSDHKDFAGEVDHYRLAEQLVEYDGFILHTSSPALFHCQQALSYVDEYPMTECFGTGTYRVASWVKGFAAFKKNVPVAYAWEPVLVKAVRKPKVTGHMVMRDWINEGITMKRGLTGAKPERVCHWAFAMAGLDPLLDEIDDLFPGTGAVSAAWDSWCAQMTIGVAA
jgi:hypothetical protein